MAPACAGLQTGVTGGSWAAPLPARAASSSCPPGLRSPVLRVLEAGNQVLLPHPVPGSGIDTRCA